LSEDSKLSALHSAQQRETSPVETLQDFPRVAVIHFCPGAVQDWITPPSPLAAPSIFPVLFDNTPDPLSKSDPSPDPDIDPSFDPPVDSLPDPKWLDPLLTGGGEEEVDGKEVDGSSALVGFSSLKHFPAWKPLLLVILPCLPLG